MLNLENLTIIWIAVLISHFLSKATRLTPVLFYLFMGAFFVNTGLLPTDPGEFILGFAEIGIILVMFALGFEESTENFLNGVKRSWGIAFFGGLAPFLAAYFVADYFWSDLKISLIFGLAMTATAVSLTLVSLKSERLHKTAAATGIMTSSVLDNIASLAMVAIIIPFAAGKATVGIASVGLILFKALSFFGVIAILASWVLPAESKGPFRFLPGFGHYGLSHVLSISKGQRILVILIFLMMVAMGSHVLGLHPAVGAYMAGLILKEEYFTEPTPSLKDSVDKHGHVPKDYNRMKRIVDNVAFVWIGPVFFVTLGAKIIFDWDVLVSVMPIVFSLTVALMVAQIISAGMAARYTGGFNYAESVMIGLGMLGRAELAFVVMDIAYVQNNILSEAAFYTLMVTAFFLNIAVPVGIRLWKPYFLKHGGKTP